MASSTNKKLYNYASRNGNVLVTKTLWALPTPNGTTPSYKSRRPCSDNLRWSGTKIPFVLIHPNKLKGITKIFRISLRRFKRNSWISLESTHWLALPLSHLSPFSSHISLPLPLPLFLLSPFSHFRSPPNDLIAKVFGL